MCIVYSGNSLCNSFLVSFSFCPYLSLSFSLALVRFDCFEWQIFDVQCDLIISPLAVCHSAAIPSEAARTVVAGATKQPQTMAYGPVIEI